MLILGGLILGGLILAAVTRGAKIGVSVVILAVAATASGNAANSPRAGAVMKGDKAILLKRLHQSAIARPDTSKLIRLLMIERGLSVSPLNHDIDSICVVEICAPQP